MVTKILMSTVPSEENTAINTVSNAVASTSEARELVA